MKLKKLQKIQTYKSEEEYKAQQIAKTSKPKVRKHFAKQYDSRIKIFLSKLNYIKQFVHKGWNGLCLGARLGEEVDALKMIGVDAIGVDLVPYPEKNVVEGDFMNLQWEDNSFDVVYTNSTDHALDIEKFFSEAHRVLKHKGFLVVDVFPGDANIGVCEVYQLDVVDIINLIVSKFDMELIYVDAKLPRLYRTKHHKETQIILRKGTSE